MANALNATLRVHGGNDLLGQPEIEFSSNANACGPCPIAVRAIDQVDPSYYPESGYLTLRRQLANFHGVGMDRLLIAASGSEFITRITALTAVNGNGAVWLPQHAYADYATAASAYRLPRAATPEEAGLVWCCDPTSPLGQTDELLARVGQLHGTVALDRAYEPLRLEGALPIDQAALDRNYAAHFAFIDHAFGTAVKSDQLWPERYGVLGDYVPNGFVKQLKFPFTWKG